MNNFFKLLNDYRIHILFLILLVLIAYANSFTAVFISDDVPSIPNNPDLTNWRYMISFLPNFLQQTIFFFLFKFFGPTPWIFRSVHILFHIGSVIVLYFLIKRMWNQKVAIISSALFAVHPVLTESITWISGGHYARYGFFFLLSFYSFIRSQENKKNLRWYIGSIVAFLFALEASPLAVAMTPILSLYLFIQDKKKEDYLRIIPYFVLTIIFALLLARTVAPRVESLESIQYGLHEVYQYNLILIIPAALTLYASLVFLPLKLSFYHSEIFSYFELAVRTIVVLLGLAGIGYFYKKNKLIFFWLCFYILSLSLLLIPIRISSATIAERYIYLGSIGLIVPIAYGLYLLTKKNAMLAWGIFATILILLTARTIMRNNDWRTYENFWTKTLETAPNSHQPHSNVGNIAIKKKDYETAIREFYIVTKLINNVPEAHYNLATAYYLSGNYEQAMIEYQKVLELNPNLPQVYQNISAIYFQQRNLAKSEEYTLKALQYAPEDPEILVNLGVIYFDKGDRVSARKIFEKVKQIDPTNGRAELGLQELAK